MEVENSRLNEITQMFGHFPKAKITAANAIMFFFSDIRLISESAHFFEQYMLRRIRKQYFIANCTFSYMRILLKVTITRIALKLFLENRIRPPTDLVNNNDDAPPSG